MILLKRAYEKPEASDGYRVLVDRLWPRGAAKAKAKLDAWDKELAPSTELRKWFAHDPKKWPEFRKRYKTELRGKKADLKELARRGKRLTLVYGARDTEHNEAVVLKELLEKLSKN